MHWAMPALIAAFSTDGGSFPRDFSVACSKSHSARGEVCPVGTGCRQGDSRSFSLRARIKRALEQRARVRGYGPGCEQGYPPNSFKRLNDLGTLACALLADGKALLEHFFQRVPDRLWTLAHWPARSRASRLKRHQLGTRFAILYFLTGRFRNSVQCPCAKPEFANCGGDPGWRVRASYGMTKPARRENYHTQSLCVSPRSHISGPLRFASAFSAKPAK